MATLPDACRALKLESPAEGGTQLDYWPKEIDPAQDALTAAGLYVQNAANSTTDKTTLISRSAQGLTFTDAKTSHVLGELVSSTTGQVGSHNALPDIIHFLSDGPGDGFASGAYLSTTFAGPLITSRVWWTTAAMTQRIFAIVYAYKGPLLSTVTYTLFNAQGVQVRLLTDTLTYNGPLLASVTRTWS